MKEGQSKLNQLAEKMEAILEKCDRDDQQIVMSDILRGAELAGIVGEPWAIRTSSPELFVADLLIDNPCAPGWVNLVAPWLDPASISDAFELIDSIRPA